eukprot:TRINITY_DN1029_c0_g2_i1.p1 TRINITY_DN1029_c0_g2~~TRINITY_DN1029_c0_g2_i1.p1  ORF type:complete len:521 (+),score=170.99 TRINITY_DN1029_c0_g2_i1:68-1630(+)
MNRKVQFFALLIAVSFGVEAASNNWFSAIKSNGEYKVVNGKLASGAAWAKFSNDMNKTGWTYLTVESNPAFDDQTQAFAAGFVEGWITTQEIHDLYLNMRASKGPLNHLVKDFPTQNLEWMRKNIRENPNDQYWIQINLILLQADGIRSAFNRKAPQSWHLDEYTFNMIQLACELGDINSTAAFKNPTMEDDHCSSLVRLTPDGKDIYASHNTWTSFSWMLRTWRNIKLNFKASSTKSKTVSYAGYPGTIPSGDDYFVTDQKLIVMETTNSVYNETLFKQVTTTTVPYWIRVTLANRMSSSGQEWNKFFGMYNSGTYNNQWIVVDTKRFTPGKGPQNGTLWISEQIPGLLYSEDKTEHLARTGFWSSYNVPYFKVISDLSGYPAHVAKHGNGSSYEWCPRAQIFRREAPKVSNFPEMKKIMRFNQYQNDPLSLGDACSSIAARCDMNSPTCGTGGSPFGAIDAKISSYSMAKTLTSEIVSGPSWDYQPPFAWTERWEGRAHHGHPKIFNFDWIQTTPNFN